MRARSGPDPKSNRMELAELIIVLPSSEELLAVEVLDDAGVVDDAVTDEVADGAAVDDPSTDEKVLALPIEVVEKSVLECRDEIEAAADVEAAESVDDATPAVVSALLTVLLES